MLKSIYLDIKSLVIHRRRSLLAQTAIYAVIGLVILSAARLTFAFAIASHFDDTNVYKVTVRADADINDIACAVESLRSELSSNDAICVFKTPDTEETPMIIGIDKFVDVFWLWHKLPDELIASDGNCAWMGSGYWQNDEDFRFPYNSIDINGTAYNVAGVCDMAIPLDDDISEMYGGRSVYIPLMTYMNSGYHVDNVIIRLFEPPDETVHKNIVLYLSCISDDVIERPEALWLSGFGAFLPAICAPVLLCCLVMLGIQTYYSCLKDASKICVQSACGAAFKTLFMEYLVEYMLLAVLGLLIAIWPSNITRLYTHYADSMTASGWICVAAGYMVCAAAIHGTAIYAGIKRALDTGFVEE